jgi:hypothetical protein
MKYCGLSSAGTAGIMPMDKNGELIKIQKELKYTIFNDKPDTIKALFNPFIASHKEMDGECRENLIEKYC